MTASLPAAAPGPTPPSQRFPWIDALRGFALLGILLMNVEIFNRPEGAVFDGLDPAALGIDHVVDWLIYVFVRTKFWILFSLLFGIGFALMLERAQASGRGFVGVYLRRTLVLLLFGALHGILIWQGDILTEYAITALFLLLAMFGRFRDGLAVTVALLLLAALFRYPPLSSYILVLLVVGLSGLYIRGDRRFRLFGREWLLAPCLLALLGLAVLTVDPVTAFLTGNPGGRFGLFIGIETLLLAWIAWKRREPAQRRPLQFGVVWYAMPFVALALHSPTPKTPQEQQQAAQMEQKRQEERILETRVLSSGTYAEAVKLRADYWWKGAGGGATKSLTGFFAVFLIGMWLVRSGIVLRPAEHGRALRRLCAVGLSLGLLLSVGSAFLPLTYIPGSDENGFLLQNFLHMLGALPLSLGYLSLVLLAWQTAAGKACLSWLAPVGRMALTNYLAQSVVCSLFFYGYGLGHWGLPRAQQAVFCLVLFAVQIVVSHLWLRHFRFGPMEWVWRRLTYGRA